MDHGALPNYGSQRKRHPQRPQRLGNGSRQTTVYFGFVVKHYQRKHADGGDCGWIAKGQF